MNTTECYSHIHLRARAVPTTETMFSGLEYRAKDKFRKLSVENNF
jgi:hypothetical protein